MELLEKNKTMNTKTQYFPMSHRPPVSKDEENHSIMVLVFDEEEAFCELGFFHFKDDEWYHTGSDSWKLKCWCMIPYPNHEIMDNKWPSVKHVGYRE